jgi:molybdate transport system substrate-binding protein
LIAAQFQQETKTAVRLTFGSSGNLFSQIQNGAPYDLFFSADVSYPEKLQSAGLTEPESFSLFGTGKLALWVRNDSSVDVTKGLAVLASNSVKKIAIANPAHAPYGRAAEAALKNAGVWGRVSSKLVIGENISQAAQFVQSGNADAGVLALSLVLAPGMKARGRYFLIPQDLYPPLQQASVVLKSSSHKQQATAFAQFVKRPQIAALLKQYGFVPAEADSQ